MRLSVQQPPYLTQIPYDFYIMTNNTVANGIFSTNWVYFNPDHQHQLLYKHFVCRLFVFDE